MRGSSLTGEGITVIIKDTGVMTREVNVITIGARLTDLERSKEGVKGFSDNREIRGTIITNIRVNVMNLNRVSI
jgi:hypothetical protein